MPLKPLKSKVVPAPASVLKANNFLGQSQQQSLVLGLAGSASTSTPCIASASWAASNVHLALKRLVFASTVSFSWDTHFLPGCPSAAAVASGTSVCELASLEGLNASSPALAPPPVSAYLTRSVGCPTGPLMVGHLLVR